MRNALQRRGPLGLLRTVVRRLSARVWLDEEHIWYALDLGRVEVKPVAAGYQIRRGVRSDAPALLELTGTPRAVDKAHGWLERGIQLWLATTETGEVAFACWIFPRTAPTIAARGGEAPLSQGVSCLEGSYTSAAHRGRGLAGAAWTHIGTELRADGVAVLVTKVEVDNAPSRRAVEKAGFAIAATMRLSRRGLRTHTSMSNAQTALTPAEANAVRALALSIGG